MFLYSEPIITIRLASIAYKYIGFLISIHLQAITSARLRRDNEDLLFIARVHQPTSLSMHSWATLKCSEPLALIQTSSQKGQSYNLWGLSRDRQAPHLASTAHTLLALLCSHYMQSELAILRVWNVQFECYKRKQFHSCCFRTSGDASAGRWRSWTCHLHHTSVPSSTKTSESSTIEQT